MSPQGRLYLVTTPLGNLDEMSPRAIQILQDVDQVAAEDTRVSRKLFNRFGITTKMTSYHQHNEKEKAKELCHKMLAGEQIALITDAGVPGLSDPGEILVQQASMLGIPVLAVSCGSAAIHALVVSGLPTGQFVFEGFLPKETGKRKKRLETSRQDPRTMIFYVTPHGLDKTLQEIEAFLGNRYASLSRELTKWYEETKRGTLQELLLWVQEEKPRGEMVLVVAGKDQDVVQPDEAFLELVSLVEAGFKLNQAASYVAKKYNMPKRTLYNQYIEESDKKSTDPASQGAGYPGRTIE